MNLAHQSWSSHRHSQPKAAARTTLLTLGLLTATPGQSGLIVNELFRDGFSGANHYAEFLVTADLTLQELDGIWFGDSRANTVSVANENQFNAAELISNISSFNSTSDVIRAGTLITVGGSNLTADFNYDPNLTDPTDSDSWNITLTNEQGFDSSGNSSPFWLNQNGDVLWISTSNPSAGGSTSDFLSALAYDSNPGNLADEIELLSQTDPNFQLITGPDFDGRLNRGNSLSNLSDAEIEFGNSESSGGTPGEANNSENLDFTYNLRAVPEPSAVISLLVLLTATGWIMLRRRKPSCTPIDT